MDEKKILKIGSRKSELALIQTNCVLDALKEAYPETSFEIVTMSTLGDQILDRPLPKIGEKSLFTKELETALVENRVDLVVHSLKDVPTTLPPGLTIGAITKREDPRDCLLLHQKHRGATLETLPEASIIGTSSLRRTAQLRRNHPKLTVESIRGNLQTRLRKLDQGLYDGIVLALAGVNRMGWDHRISQVLKEHEMLYAVGQGALAVECRQEDAGLFSLLTDRATALQCVAERGLLSCLGAGCSAPLAVTSCLDSEQLGLTAAVWSLDGSRLISEQLSCCLSGALRQHTERRKDYCGFSGSGLDAEEVHLAHQLGCDLAGSLAGAGAVQVIEQAKLAYLAT